MINSTNVIKTHRTRSNFRRVPIFIYLILLSLRVASLTAKPTLNVMEKLYGFSLETAKYSTAIGGFYGLNFGTKTELIFHARLMDIVGKTEFPVYDPYTDAYYKASEKNLLLIPLYSGVRFHPFVGRIANNFSPFVTASLGPLLILDTPEHGGFLERWKRVEALFSFGGLVGIGINFNLPAKSIMAISLGYEYLPMGREVDEETDYSGIFVRFMLGKTRRAL